MDRASASVFVEPAAAAKPDRGRDSLFLLAQLKVADSPDELTVRVRNISAGGLMAELPEPVAPDAAVNIQVRGLGWLAGRIAWQTEGRAGISFDQAIDPQLARRPVVPAEDEPQS